MPSAHRHKCGTLHAADHFPWFAIARTLEKHRTYGTGPTYRKIGGRGLYTVDDLQSWADIGARKSTSDVGAGTVFPARPLTPEERSKL